MLLTGVVGLFFVVPRIFFFFRFGMWPKSPVGQDLFFFFVRACSG